LSRARTKGYLALAGELLLLALGLMLGFLCLRALLTAEMHFGRSSRSISLYQVPGWFWFAFWFQLFLAFFASLGSWIAVRSAGKAFTESPDPTFQKGRRPMLDRSFHSHAPAVRLVGRDEYAQWRPLWDGYNAFYGRSGPTALDEPVTAQTWERFFDAGETVRAFVAELEGRIVGITHFLFHRSTSRLADVCYLQDLFTEEACRGRGVGRALIQAVIDAAKQAGSSRVYWATQTTNVAGRALYDKMAQHSGFLVYSHEL
jgi:GNAT superfamily N-acetyltransferase